MKIRHFIFIIVAALSVAFTSCDLEGESNYTPFIILNFVKPVTQTNDSLEIFYTDQSNVFLLDTIQAGDTVTFRVGFNGFTNNLKAMYISQSADSVTRIILPNKLSMDSIFTTESDYAKGKFMMNGTTTFLYFPFRYVARSASKEAKLTLTIVSDAVFEDGFGSNTTTMTLKTPIQP